MRIRTILATSSLAFAAAACGGDPEVAAGDDALVAVCLDASAPAPSGAWMCGETRVVECTSPTTRGPTLYVREPTCGVLSVSDPGPFPVGSVEIDVVLDEDRQLCTSTLIVEDTTPPVVTDRRSTLWPPNHQLHHFAVADCAAVTDACDPTLELSFTYVASDEPLNAQGDGNTEGDVVLDCDGVDLRSERQGGNDGRVYTLGVRARDGDGNVTDGTCTVSVAHDQGNRGTAVPSTPAYRIDAPARCATFDP